MVVCSDPSPTLGVEDCVVEAKAIFTRICGKGCEFFPAAVDADDDGDEDLQEEASDAQKVSNVLDDALAASGAIDDAVAEAGVIEAGEARTSTEE